MGKSNSRDLLSAGVVRDFFFPDGNAGLERYTNTLRGDWYVMNKRLLTRDGVQGYAVTIVQQYNQSPLWQSPNTEANRVAYYHGFWDSQGHFSYNCSRCGHSIDEQDCYCKGCGAKIIREV